MFKRVIEMITIAVVMMLLNQHLTEALPVPQETQERFLPGIGPAIGAAANSLINSAFGRPNLGLGGYGGFGNPYFGGPGNFGAGNFGAGNFGAGNFGPGGFGGNNFGPGGYYPGGFGSNGFGFGGFRPFRRG